MSAATIKPTRTDGRYLRAAPAGATPINMGTSSDERAFADKRKILVILLDQT
ncbi:MAG TPA: hypothetical protein PLU30_12050 [Verrucomicrobiae bacterium]|nr:hypothetical protein [Verrucomicrobiae bacterium]